MMLTSGSSLFQKDRVRCRTKFINIFGENENRKDVKNNIEAAPFD
jgi:hypothetical protein